jgi:type 1 fimbria pilin
MRERVMVNKIYNSVFEISALIILSFAFSSSNANAGTGFCTATNGTNLYTIPVNETLTDRGLNQPGQTFSSVFSNIGAGYDGSCDCDQSDIDKLGDGYFKAEYLPSTTPGSRDRYVIVNDYVDVSVAFKISGSSTLTPVPFTDESNDRYSCNIRSFITGGSGSLTLLIKKPFVGKLEIPQRQLAAIWGTVRKGSYSSEPMTKVAMSGYIIVPQNCEINAGNVINVQFSPISRSKFLTKGQKPDGYLDERTTISYICNNIDDGVQVSMSFQAAADTEIPDAIATSNKNVGIIITDTNGIIIPPNTGEVPMPILRTNDYQNQKGAVDILSYPINTTGQSPGTGTFESHATIKLDIR